MRRVIAILALLFPGMAAAGQSAPPLMFDAGTVLAGGYVLAASVTLAPVPGRVDLPTRDNGVLHWTVIVKSGETQLLQPDGRWAARAEFSRVQRDGRTVCLAYQTTLSPEWAVRGRERQDRADIAVADDLVYSFREVPCP